MYSFDVEYIIFLLLSVVLNLGKFGEFLVYSKGDDIIWLIIGVNFYN